MTYFARHSAQSGFIKWIILIIIIILLLSYFGFDLRGLINDDQTQDNFSVVTEWIIKVWNNYLERPAQWIWENILQPLWDIAHSGIEKLQSGDTVPDELPEAP